MKKHLNCFKRNEAIENTNKTLNKISVYTKWFGIKRKSIGRVLKEVAEKYNTLDDDTQKEVRVALAGKKSETELNEYLIK